MTDIKREILELAIQFVKKHKRYPSFPECQSIGVSRKTIDYHYGNMTNFRKAVSEKTTAIICDLEQHEIATAPSKKIKRFVITTVVPGAEIHEGFYKNIKAYCKDFDAELLVLLSLGHNRDSLIVPPILKNDVFIMSDTNLNSNVFILGLKNTAAKVDPITGLPRIGQRNGTFICASPKQRLKYIATGPSKLPHALMSTGALTYPNYIKSTKLVEKSAYVADNDHVMGAVILELDENEMFHFRQVQCTKDGSFVDLGTYYVGGKKRTLAPEAFVLGDWHSGETCPITANTWYDISKKLKVKQWIIHDGFSGSSVNHHNTEKIITLTKQADEGKLNLNKELSGYAADIIEMLSKIPKVVIVKSNHDEFLERYLEEARYVHHPYNHRMAIKLAGAFLDGHNPVEYFVHEIVKVPRKNIKWLQRDEDYQIAGIQLGSHGDKGANGSRGSINALENAHGNVVYGHSHTPEIQRGAFCVGTSTPPKPDYGTGPSSWMNASCLVYENGQRQMINSINGKWTTRKF